MTGTGPLRYRWLCATIAAAIALAASPATAALIVDASVTDTGGGVFNWDILVTNTGPEDFSLVSLVDGPLNDPLIDPTLTSPAEFSTSYDPGLGIVDFIEGLSPFGAGTANGGFMFDSVAAPNTGGFQTYEALDTVGNLVIGPVNQRAVPETTTLTLMTVGLIVVAWRRARALRR